MRALCCATAKANGSCSVTATRANARIRMFCPSRSRPRSPQDGERSTGGVAFDASGVGRERLEEAYSAYVKRYRAVGMDIAEQAMEIAPAAHTSLGGVYARPDCSTSVEGLFVCGETLGGLHGANRIGGNAGLETMVFGRRAGCSAAAYMDTLSGEPADCTDEISDAAATVNIDALRAELTKIVGGALGVIREAGKLEQAKTELERMLESDPGERLLRAAAPAQRYAHGICGDACSP